ncbi:MAG: carotenoid oxygenase family protein [Scytolyngbya sp. HA4215-MV1]|nr:carotenoid oxygenase family protein [Scytolyngbya sp. HA4215-MV1]
MVATISQRKQFPTWSKAVRQTASEFGLTTLSVLSGSIPEGLRGSLYRNGPARLERGGKRVGHWFDGDGAVLAVQFAEAGATAVYRYVKTTAYEAEEKAGKLLFGGYGMTPPGALWDRFKTTKNAANTSVLALPDKLLALWEGGNPHALDLQTLDTIGLDDLGGLPENLPYSAHPKRDPQTGEIFNFGITYGKTGAINVYRSGATGKILQKGTIPLDGLPLIHDFVMAGSYLLFFVSPVRMNPLYFLTRLKSYSDSLAWQPELGTQIVVVDRNTLEVVCRSEAEAWYQWHFGNGFVETDGVVVLDLVRYRDFDETNQFLKEVGNGETQRAATGQLCQLRIDPKTGKMLEMTPVTDRGCEFPVVNPQEVGQASRYTYLSTHRPGIDPHQELFGAIARFDYQTETLTIADLGENRYPMEPIYAPDRHDPAQGWIVTVVFDGNCDRSEVWIYNAAHLDQPPICRLGLPGVIPPGFHGTWQPA